MEEKFNASGESEAKESPKSGSKPALTSDYSEPIDKDVHLYSELKQKDEQQKKRRDASPIALRPLPDKPGGLLQPGPSTKM